MKKVTPLSMLAVFGLIVITACEHQGGLPHRLSDFPNQIQATPMECGPVCLKIITDYYGQDIPLDSIYALSGYEPADGCTLLGMDTAIQHLGYITLPVQVTYDDLEIAPLPGIMFWTKNHFLVVYHLTQDSVWISDPARGKLTLSRKAFEEGWAQHGDNRDEGIALLLEPQ